MAQAVSAPRAAAPVVAAKRPKPSAVALRLAFYALVVIILLYTLVPFYWAIRSSFTPSGDLFKTPVQYFPARPTFEHYKQVLSTGLFRTALLNSAVTAVSVTILALIIGAFASYALGRFRFRGRTPVLYLVLSMTMFPQIAVLGALFEIVRSPLGFIPAGWADLGGFGPFFGWLRGLSLYDKAIPLGQFNTHILPALVLTYLIFTLPFTVWTLTNFFRAMPGELEEAAYVDGATPFQTFYKVLLPLAGPGMVTTGLLAFIAAWNEFLFALSFMQQPQNRTVNLAIFYFSGSSGSQFEVPWGQIMAATVIVTVPIVILVLIFQRRIIAGLTAGAVKG
jgi:trehalose/maltose transport system permease protein